MESFLERIRDELVTGEYLPQRNRRQEIPKDGGKVRVLGIPTIRDRVVQGALKLIVEPIFEADFQAGSYGYRPQRSADDAVERVAEAIVGNKTRVIDVDLERLQVEVNEDKSRTVDLAKGESFKSRWHDGIAGAHDTGKHDIPLRERGHSGVKC